VSPPRRYNDNVLLGALRGARSLTDAADGLGMSRGALEKRCRTGTLAAEYAACAARGNERRKLGGGNGGANGRGLLAMTEAELDELERLAAAQ